MISLERIKEIERHAKNYGSHYVATDLNELLAERSKLRAIAEAAKNIYDTSVNHVTSDQTLCYKAKYFHELGNSLDVLE